MSHLTHSARSLARAALKSSRRGYATVADAGGIKVAAVAPEAPNAAITVVVKAGSRFENAPGVANALKNFAFKSTNKRSALGIVRETELQGGVLSASLTREHLFLTAEFLKGDEGYFAELLGEVVGHPKFATHEFNESVVPLIASDYAQAQGTPSLLALDAAHSVAFRKGLGNSLFADPHSGVSVEDVRKYAAQTYTKGNLAVFGTGVESSTLSTLVQQYFANVASAPGPSSSRTTYFGGESRIARNSHDGPATLLFAFGAPQASHTELAVLRHLLGGESSIKWSSGQSPLAAAAAASGVTMNTLATPYSDAGLFSVLIQSKSNGGSERIAPAAQKAVQILKEVAGGASQEAVKTAVAKARFEAASGFETAEGLTRAVGTQILAGNVATAESAISAFDKVSASGVSSLASALLKSKPTVVSVGDSRVLPYADEIGL